MIAEPWLKTAINTERVCNACPFITAIFSDNDLYVPLEKAKLFDKRLHARTVMLHNKKHFGGEDGVLELPEALQAILQIAGLEK